MSDPVVRLLTVEDTSAIVDLFGRVYGDSYANPLFYDAKAISKQMAAEKLFCVGAVEGCQLLAHMAMIRSSDQATPELGNTVVDPVARGDGLAWKVGTVLMDLCRSLGHAGYLHFPTTDHHIMQRQSVKQGFETGLMLGYIPRETHGQVGGKIKLKRTAATIVYEPLLSPTSTPADQLIFVPTIYQSLLNDMITASGVPRAVELCPFESSPFESSPFESRPVSTLSENSVTNLKVMERRSLTRLTFDKIGHDAAQIIQELSGPCQQIDMRMDDSGIEFATRNARQMGFVFSGWLPSFLGVDVLRLQKFDPLQTDLRPALENEMAQQVLRAILDEL